MAPSEQDEPDGAPDALAAYGFEFNAWYADRVNQYVPLRECPTPEHGVLACFGTIEDARVEAFAYEWSRRDEEGYVERGRATLVVVQHPSVPGSASLRPDPRAWSRVATVVDALLWVPPFTVGKAIGFLKRTKDREVGDREFDRRYVVRAESDDDARRAFGPALRRALLTLNFEGSVEMRPGLLLYSPHRTTLEGRSAVETIGVAAALVGALRGGLAAHPMR